MLNSVPDRRTSRDFALALSQSRDWRHRRIESLRLMDDQAGRRRVSIDCVPPASPGLAYEASERGRKHVRDVSGPIMVPLGYITKGPLRAFDISAETGPVPVLGRAEYRFLLIGALEYELEDAARRCQRHNLRRALEVVVDGQTHASEKVAGKLLDQGRFENFSVLNPKEITERAAELLTQLSQRFILVGLVPSELAGTRTVVKYSYHWRTHPYVGRHTPLRTRALTAVGLTSTPWLVEIGRPCDDRSFHLEVHAPAGLQCSGLQLPDSGTDQDLEPRNLRDTTEDIVAHAVGNYDREPSDAYAVLQLAVADGALKAMAFLVSLLTVITLSLALWADGARKTIMEDGDGTAALLLAVPAIVIALLVRPGENQIARKVLAPLRHVIVVCALTLFAVAASIVGSLVEPWLTVLWHAGLFVPALALAGLTLGYVSHAVQTARTQQSRA